MLGAHQNQKAVKDKTHFSWGVQPLPWLILTDEQHIVQAEGFNIDELDDEIKKITET